MHQGLGAVEVGELLKAILASPPALDSSTLAKSRSTETTKSFPGKQDPPTESLLWVSPYVSHRKPIGDKDHG